MSALGQQEIGRCLANRDAVLAELDRIDAEESLLSFIRLMWPELEPARALVEGWCLQAVCEHLQAITEGHIRDLVIAIPPGCMKSLSTTVFWPVWEWGPRSMPSRRLLTASYSTDLTYRDNRKARRLIESKTFQTHWRDRFSIASDANRVERIETTQSGFRLATSVGGAGMGERIDVAVVDDPIKAKDADSTTKIDEALRWYAETLSTRSTDPGKLARVVIMQRLNARDIIGDILARDLGYELLVLPMRAELDHPDARKTTCLGWSDPRKVDGELLWPERFPEDYVAKLEIELGPHGVASQLQQRPTPRGGGLFKVAWFKYEDKAPATGVAVRGWDLAASDKRGAAYTAGTKMRRCAGGFLWIEDVVRLRADPRGTYDLILATAMRDGRGVKISIPQDPGAAGLAQKGELGRLLEGFDVSFSPETGSKEARADPLAGQAAAGNVYLVRGAWNDSYVAEAITFPNGAFCDMVDSSSRAYAKLLTLANRPHTFVAPTLIRTD